MNEWLECPVNRTFYCVEFYLVSFMCERGWQGLGRASFSTAARSWSRSVSSPRQRPSSASTTRITADRVSPFRTMNGHPRVPRLTHPFASPAESLLLSTLLGGRALLCKFLFFRFASGIIPDCVGFPEQSNHRRGSRSDSIVRETNPPETKKKKKSGVTLPFITLK